MLCPPPSLYLTGGAQGCVKAGTPSPLALGGRGIGGESWVVRQNSPTQHRWTFPPPGWTFPPGTGWTFPTKTHNSRIIPRA